MIGSKTVIKFDGREEPFDAKKLFRWAEYAAKTDPNISWEEIALETYKRIPNKVSSSDIHETMIKVLEETKDVSYTRVSARLRIATLRKNMERKLGVNVATDSFEKIYEALLDKGVWCRNTLPPYSKNMEDWWNSNKREVYQSWSVQQFEDKYAVRIDGIPVEVPQLAMLGIGLGLFGDKEEAYQFATAANKKQINLPTPLMNGSRNGDFDTVSCCVIEAEDSVESILTADHIAARMTAKKAGIGVKYNTRSKNADVKGGRVKHLGKHPIFRNTLGSVGVFSQITRGGSATVSVDIIDPEVYNTAIWKSQRSDIRVRLDWLDFSVCFNDYFIKCVVERKPWHFFSMDKAPEIYEAFPTASVEEFESLVEKAVKEGRHHSSTDALKLIGDILELRVETGRIYFTNLSRMNEHSPFEDTIRLSNLCQLAA